MKRINVYETVVVCFVMMERNEAVLILVPSLFLQAFLYFLLGIIFDAKAGEDPPHPHREIQFKNCF